MNDEIPLEHENFMNSFENFVGFTGMWIPNWERTSSSNVNTGLIDYSTHDCACIYMLKLIN